MSINGGRGAAAPPRPGGCRKGAGPAAAAVRPSFFALFGGRRSCWSFAHRRGGRATGRGNRSAAQQQSSAESVWRRRRGGGGCKRALALCVALCGEGGDASPSLCLYVRRSGAAARSVAGAARPYCTHIRGGRAPRRPTYSTTSSSSAAPAMLHFRGVTFVFSQSGVTFPAPRACVL